MSNVVNDLRYSIRNLIAKPAFSLMTILMLCVGDQRLHGNLHGTERCPRPATAISGCQIVGAALGSIG